MFSKMYSASTLEELRVAYHQFVKRNHPDNFYHTGDNQLIEMYTSYMKQAHKLFDERTKEIEENIALSAPPITATARKGIYYKDDLKLADVCNKVKEFIKDISTRFCSFNCYTKSGVLYVYASKGSMLLSGYTVVTEDFIDYIDSKYPEYFKTTALFILGKINQYRKINTDRTTNFKVHLSIGKSQEQPYRVLKPSVYTPHNTSYWLEQVKSGKSDFSSIPKRYRTEGFVTMCISSSELLAEEVIKLFPELLTKDSINMVRKNFPNLRKLLPKKQKSDNELCNKIIKLSVEALIKYTTSPKDSIVLTRAAEECLGLITVSSGQVASIIGKIIEPSDTNFKILCEMDNKIVSDFLYKPLNTLLMRKTKMPENEYIWNPSKKVWEEK